MQQVVIRHPDGREYGIDSAAFTSPKVSVDRRSYADQGFEIVSCQDGTPFDGPKTLKAIEAAKAERAEAREAKAAEQGKRERPEVG